MSKFFIKLSTVILLIMIIAMWPKEKVSASTFNNNENGIITVKYNNTSGSKMKLLVQAKSVGYSQNYNLSSGENVLEIPLTGGNVTYTLLLCKRIEGTSYTAIDTYEVSLDLSNEGEVFLYSNVIVEYQISDKVVKKASALTKNCTTEKEIVEKIHEYVVENNTYDYDKIKTLETGYIPDIEVIYKDKKGICYDFSVMLAAMLRTQGIEVKVVTGYADDIDGYHAWNQVYDTEEKEWYTIDATYDICYNSAGRSYSLEKNENEYDELKYIY